MRRSPLKLGTLFLLSSLAVVGCYKHSFNVGNGGNVNADPTFSNGWESHWLFGIIGETNVDVKKICPSGNATVKDRHSFLNGLVGSLIGIVWYPTTVEVYCDGGGRAASVQVTPEQMRQIALSPETLDWARQVSQVKAAELAQAAAIYRDAHKNVATGVTTSSY
jgi:hypothetical protein